MSTSLMLSLSLAGYRGGGGAAILSARFDPATDTIIVTLTPFINGQFDPSENTVTIKINGTGTPPVSYDTDAEAYFANMSVQPDATRKQLISDFFADLKTYELYNKMACMWIKSAHDPQAGLLDLKGNYNLTAVNSPAFVVDRGYASDGSTSYLDTNYNPSTAAGAFTLNSGAIGIYINGGNDEADSSKAQMGATGGNGSLIVARGASDAYRGRINVGLTATFGSGATTRRGFSVVSRTASNLTTYYRNGAATGTSDANSASVPNSNFYIGGASANGEVNPSTLSDGRYAFAFISSGLDATEAANLNTLVNTLLEAIGADA